MVTAVEESEAKAIAAFKTAPVTVEDVARAWASIDGKAVEFDHGKGLSVSEDKTGHYAGYCHEALELLERATRYATARQNKQHG